jgi:hypothetical protein
MISSYEVSVLKLERKGPSIENRGELAAAGTLNVH